MSDLDHTERVEAGGALLVGLGAILAVLAGIGVILTQLFVDHWRTTAIIGGSFLGLVMAFYLVGALLDYLGVDDVEVLLE